ncbi:aminotransferase class I/II-fold pyridoxal phosphate-dependent enzyme [Ralstonia insidiosa]|jgi:8-amino-7-oxononanoate synthase|uniref:aminotransferase class I/II-fold pyridoxal phosphate-dependent enzyme n=1 Tax=Ralstonia TaxID=48736 RepID=UPI000664A3DF|nr:aminotransferase class I/II-fold pyridoxal phosphate-dependent enzyme [Ralstonia insidiosa]KMW47027.1 8-amino-7-oxononanoate synthase [Ralstonia sp. MD27]MBX3775479.1 aminotransferase class I/II-fold pyridoxal phosphate-dependent enzyme [Ralstonia pickettii]NOZ14380.1 aminotransferase class I/II-fold pyridoxal phosphate-dependent enzyme [Betaproteobacteria bacterium]MBA9859675.1 aminotransferase class I/II-fold pyridoxal phosphate-dependent enzyme [Ralstonia insidiosa]MBA9873211.1 aminotran
MRLGDQLRQQLAAKALKRQLDRVTKELETGAERAAATVHNGQAAQPATPADYAALCRFDTLPAYQQVSIIREVSERMGIASPFFRVHEGVAGATTQINGQSYINFANYNYLGLAGDSVVSENAKAAIDQYGTSASASRMVAGERPIQRDLERALADLYEVDDCVAFVSGHATNVTTIGCLFGPGDLILHDALAHNSIVQGAQLSGAKRLNFPHNDWAALDALLTRVRRDYRRVLIAVEGIYSMDGDFPELERFIDIKRRHGAFLMVDEAHSLGVLGATGRGIREHFGLAGRDVDIWMGTFSKTLAGCGGYIAGEQALIDILRHLAPGFLYSVGLSPVLAASSLSALQRMLEEPQRIATLRERGRQFLETAREAGLNTGLSAGYSVVPVIVGSSLKAAQWANALFEKGINTQPIFYPAVEEKAARLRFFICSTHTPEQIAYTVATVAQLASK